MLLRMENVFKIYGAGENKVFALDGICLQIGEGEFVSIVGQSGSGKSTLMNIMGCLDTPTSGSYYLQGENVGKLPDSRLSFIRNNTIGFIFQGYNLIPTLTAAENVELPLMFRGIPRKQRIKMASTALERVGLEKRMGHRPSQMSGGQQQRVAIARAIAASPSIILADEPTGNLDSQSGRQVLDILQDLNREGKTIILITHDRNVARLGRRQLTILDGKLVSDL